VAREKDQTKRKTTSGEKWTAQISPCIIFTGAIA
jgi:hypothetical protein